MYPAIQFRIRLELVKADDGLGVQVVLNSNKQKAEDYDERSGLDKTG